jgi:hypothetical protein
MNNSKLPVDDIVNHYIQTSATGVELARHYKVPLSTIYRILNKNIDATTYEKLKARKIGPAMVRANGRKYRMDNGL